MKRIVAVLIGTILALQGELIFCSDELPNAIDEFAMIQRRLSRTQPVLFLDYDGTLSNIVDNPDLAFMTPEMKVALDSASRNFPTAIVTGRSLKTIWEFVPDHLYFAGGHGHDICGPFKYKLREIGSEYVQQLGEVEHLLEERLRDSGVEGYSIENNVHAVSVHYRHVKLAAHIEAVLRIVKETIEPFQDSLEITLGAKVWEIRPKTHWHKGFAIAYFLKSIFKSTRTRVPIYMGDDKGDEAAFIEVNKRGGVSILVTSTAFPHGVTSNQTDARFVLSDPTEVQKFLESLAALKKSDRQHSVNVELQLAPNTTDWN